MGKSINKKNFYNDEELDENELYKKKLQLKAKEKKQRQLKKLNNRNENS